MTLTYQLDYNDFLEHQLFAASKSERIKKKRLNSYVIITGAMFLLAYLFYNSNNLPLFYYFLFIGVISLLFYPSYQRFQYKKHYAKFIMDTYKNRFGETTNIHFTEHLIEIKDSTGEAKFDFLALENVTETAAYFYPRLKSGVELIIPKSKVNDVSQVAEELKQLCERHKINFIEDLNWKWR